MRVDAPGRGAGDELVPVEQPERACRLGRSVEQGGRRSEQVQLLAEGDAVEVHHPHNLLELAAQLRLVDVVARAGQLDFLGRERNQAHTACEAAPGQRRADPADAFDSRCVVDRTGPVPTES